MAYNFVKKNIFKLLLVCVLLLLESCDSKSEYIDFVKSFTGLKFPEKIAVEYTSDNLENLLVMMIEIPASDVNNFVNNNVVYEFDDCSELIESYESFFMNKNYKKLYDSMSNSCYRGQNKDWTAYLNHSNGVLGIVLFY